MTADPRVWLILDCAPRPARALAERALRSGDQVAVAGRERAAAPADVALALCLDDADPGSVVTAVHHTLLALGRLDVVILDGSLAAQPEVVATIVPVLQSAPAGRLIVIVTGHDVALLARCESIARDAALAGVRFSTIGAAGDVETFIERAFKAASS
jgi:hypothetical protein